ncbi:MAG: redoxin domain-containing protein [Phycisphaerae bacterium]|nr:redoxin domain-containing protein [Phycisphaerae bacterium]
MQKMQKMRKLQFILAVSVLCGGVLFLPEAFGQKKAAPKKAAKVEKAENVPKDVFKEIKAQFPPRNMDPVAQKRILPARMQKVLELGKDAETKYPKAENLYQVQTIMLHAAGYLARQKNGKVTEKQYQEIADKILTSNAPVEDKVNTEFIVLSREVLANKMPEQQMGKKLEGLVKKYEKTPVAPKVLINAVVLSYQTKNQELADKYLDILKKKYPDNPDTKELIAAIDRMPKAGGKTSGKIFEAKLKTLDGKTITMPKDTKGKIVVVDFWASWCGPCRRLIPHLIKFHDKYAKNADVMIIGISLDKDEAAMKKYIKDAKIPWAITYTGKGWGDPTVKKYGIDGIPSVWIIGKDGKVVSTDAAGNEDKIVAKLLAEKPTTPPDKAGKPGKSASAKTPNKPAADKDK